MEQDSAGIRFPPPLYFLIGLAIGWGLDRLYPLPLLKVDATRLIGGVLIALGVLLAVSAVASLRRAGTTILPDQPTTAIVVAGPYHFSRNPIYLSFFVDYIGIAMVMNSLWPLLLLPVVFVFIRNVVRREERYLAGKFGERYGDYRGQVRRWL